MALCLGPLLDPGPWILKFHSFDRYQLSIYYGPGPVPGSLVCSGEEMGVFPGLENDDSFHENVIGS